MVLNGNSAQQSGLHLRARYCIVGSGMGGSSLARSLAEAGEDVLLVEAGGPETQSLETAPVFNESSGRPFGIPLTRNIELGGTSNAWHGICTPLEEIDFQERPWIPNSGWPIQLKELLPFYETASGWMLETSDARYDAKSQSAYSKRLRDIDFNREILENKLFFCQKPAFRWKQVLPRLAQEGKLRCLTGTAALELQLNHDGSRVEKLLAGTDSSKLVIEAETFIISAGALETPRLLLNSRTRDGVAIGNRHDLVGRYLLDHPTALFSKLRFHAWTYAPLYAGIRFHRNVRIMTGLRVTSDRQHQHQLPNHGIWMRPSLSEEGISDELRRSFLGKKRKRDLTLKQMAAIFGCKDIWYRILVVRFGLPAIYRYGDLCFFGEQLPNPASRVSLSENQRDNWGFPVANVRWQLMAEDFRLFDNYVSLLFSQGLRSDQYELAREDAPEIWERTLTSAAHHAGTARMASNPSRGVVDQNLKVFGTSNLYVCDASVFPTNGSANPSLTIAALGVRLGKHLMAMQKAVHVDSRHVGDPAAILPQ